MLPAQELRSWFSGLPNKLTFIRIAAVPVIVLIYPVDESPFPDLRVFIQVVAALLFLAAAATDFFDGYLARKYQMETAAGALLDPIADKLLVVAGLVLLVAAKYLYASVAVVLIGRDLAISGLRLLALEKNLDIKVNQFGKLKTAAQLTGISCLMIHKSMFGISFKNIGNISITIAVVLSLYSAYLYVDEFRKHLKIDL